MYIRDNFLRRRSNIVKLHKIHHTQLPAAKGIAAIIICTLVLMLTPWIQTSRAAEGSTANEALEQRIKAMEAEIKKLREETDVRKKLAPTKSEQTEKEAEILSAAGRQYTLRKNNTLGLEYRFSYSYNSYDIISQITSVEQEINHTLTNSFYLEYGLLDNLALNANLPFVYKYDSTGTSQSKSVTDIGDFSFGAGYQPFKSGGNFPTTLLFANAILPSGRSPYEIDINNDLSTGSGAYGLSTGASFSKNNDPVVVYGSIFYTYYLPITDLSQNRGSDVLREVELGQTISTSIGMAYSISYKVSMNFSYTYSYATENTYDWETADSTTSGTATRSAFSLGAGWRMSPTRSLSLNSISSLPKGKKKI